MTLNFGASLFPSRGEISPTYNYTDTIQGQGFLSLYLAKTMGNVEELFTYDENDDAEASVTTSLDRLAQVFTTGSEDVWIESVEVKANFDTSSPYFLIEETTDGVPNGTELVKFISSGGGSTNGSRWRNMAFGSNLRPKLEANTQYAIIIKNGTSANDLDWRVDETSPTFTGGNMYQSLNDGASWTEISDTTAMFRICGSSENPYIMSQSIISSETLSTTKYVEDDDTGAGTTPEMIMENEFEKEFLIPAVLEGEATIEYYWTRVNIDYQSQQYLNMTLTKRQSDGTETELSVGRGAKRPGSREVIKLNIPRTKISASDVLVLKVEVWIAQNVYDLPATFGFYHDPEENTENTNFKITLPFRITI